MSGSQIQGIYLPFWTYDCQTTSHYRGERGDYYTVTETYTETDSDGNPETKTRQVQKTRWTSVSGYVNRFFDDVLVAGTTAVNGQHLAAIASWDLANLVTYNSSYLAGFKAQRYQISLKAGFEQAKVQMADQIHSDVQREIGGDEQRIHSVSTSYQDITFKHILLPVWVATYHFKNRRFSVMVNARTGKVTGDRPFSLVKISLAALAVVSVIAGIFGVKTYLNNPASLPSMRMPNIHVPFPRQPNSRPPGSSSVPVPGSSVPPSPTRPTDATFRQAISLAEMAVTRGQRAKTRQDWEQVASLWEQAIILMTNVQPSSPNYAVAQRKAIEYQQYLNHARQQVRRLPFQSKKSAIP